MAKPGFYNDNSHRAYPLLAGQTAVPDAAVVDAGFMMGIGSAYVEGTHRVYLSAVRREGGVWVFVFESDAPGLAGLSLEFRRNVGETDYQHEYATSQDAYRSSLSESVSAMDACPRAYWSGYLVTGDLTDLAATTQNATVEPATVVNLQQKFVRSLNVANAERTRATYPDGCNELCWPFDRQDMYVQGVCLQAPVRFKQGYNCAIRQNSYTNTIVFDASVGAGEGQPCGEVPLFSEEMSPVQRDLLDGSMYCHNVVRTINGVGGRILNVTGGPGVTVTPHPTESRLVIDVNTRDLAICAEFEEEDECSLSESTSDSCDCGPAA